MSVDQVQDPVVLYEQLEDLEDDFEDVELELIRHNAKLAKDLYTKREKLIAKIPGFWPLVFEQAPMDIDEYIQPSDSAVISGHLTNLTVERFELPENPRSLKIKFEFSENEWFENKTLEKKFWWRDAKDGWAGLVSEPVDIKWKKNKDLTGGMLSLACKVFEEAKAGTPATEVTETKKALKAKMEQTGLGGVSFFAWFGARGRDISAEESAEASKKKAEQRQARKDGKEVDVMDEGKDDEEEDDEDDEYEYEIFPTADDLAISFAEDLYPEAIKYFISAQEQDASDEDFESGAEDEDEDEMDEDDKPKESPNKKRKA
jgi:hypothetical protein